MFVVTYVYNTLNRLVRSIKMQANNVMASIGGVALLVGITITLLDPSIKGVGAFICGFGLAMCSIAYFRVQAEDKKEREKQRKEMRLTERMIEGIDKLNDTVSNLLQEIIKKGK